MSSTEDEWLSFSINADGSPVGIEAYPIPWAAVETNISSARNLGWVVTEFTDFVMLFNIPMGYFWVYVRCHVFD